MENIDDDDKRNSKEKNILTEKCKRFDKLLYKHVSNERTKNYFSV